MSHIKAPCPHAQPKMPPVPPASSVYFFLDPFICLSYCVGVWKWTGASDDVIVITPMCGLKRDMLLSVYMQLYFFHALGVTGASTVQM